jgi:hypothetical protein
MAPIVSGLVFQHSSAIAGSRLLATTNAMGSSTRRAGVASLLHASVDDTATTYFLTTNGKTKLCKFNPNVVNLLIFMKI